MRKVLICILLLAAGCSWFADNRVAAKSKIKNPELYRAVLRALIVKTNHPEWTTNELLFEIEYQKYLMSLEAEDGR